MTGLLIILAAFAAAFLLFFGWLVVLGLKERWASNAAAEREAEAWTKPLVAPRMFDAKPYMPPQWRPLDDEDLKEIPPRDTRPE